MKIAFVCLTLVTLVGCAALKQARVDAGDCLADPACREEAVRIATEVKNQTTALAGISSIPLSSNAAGSIAYSIALALALVRQGKKKRENKP